MLLASDVIGGLQEMRWNNPERVDCPGQSSTPPQVGLFDTFCFSPVSVTHGY